MRGSYQKIDCARRGVSAGTALLSAALILGCDRSPAPPATTTAPAVAPIDRVPDAATRASAIQTPADATILVDGQRQTFPPARVVLHNKNGKLTALLYSDDPADAIKDTYVGNGFYVQMPLDVDTPAEIGAAVWHVTSSNMELDDSPYGIFLRGHRQRLQPRDVTVQFSGNDTDLTLWMSGTWMLFEEADDNSPPRLVPVTAKLRPTVTIKPPKP